MARKGRRRGKIRIKKSLELRHRNDATRVTKPQSAQYPIMNTQMPRSNGAVLKVKLKKK